MSLRDLFVYRTETCWKTSWLLRLLALVGCALVLLGTKGCWAPALGQSVVHTGPVVASDALLIDNLEPDFSLFDRAGQLQRRGVAGRVVVPVPDNPDGTPSRHALPIVEVMSRMARVENAEPIAYREEEPISLNVAKQMLGYLQKTGARSVVVISPALRSERSYRVYDSVFRPAGIEVSCVPVFSRTTPENWTESWHGIQDVMLQFGKLWYYRLVIGI